ncbi:unnamed protein product [Cyclocybe aegerita]|uniref:BZIP domain-containing protein n=1 Tax=Cyclocybe aegerita TaxID=1973307 RepID=A0A8S0WL59_CYCAE|nr:unnamed protein product [Cyclocybe aegerita]
MQSSEPVPCNAKDEPTPGDLLMSQYTSLYDPQAPSSTANLSGISPASFTMSLSAPSTPSTPLHTHNRSISSESAASLVERSVPSRIHPSLQAYQFGRPPRISPEPSSSTSSPSHPPPNPNHRRAVKPGPSRKRPAHQALSNSDDDEDLSEELDPLDPDATEEEKKAYNRRRNTLAARRSRARRAQEFQQLKEENTRLTRETAVWKERALMMERVLAAHGYPIPSFSR